jgi:outer membrane immunogenic protein
MKGTQNIDTSVPGFSVGFGTASQDLNWLATIRGRVGYAWNNVLVYGTGGVAFGDVDYRYNFAFPQTAENYNVSTSKTQTGFAVGGGIEYGIGAWSFKVEYIYFDLGGGATYAATAIGAPGSSTHFATFDDTQGHIVRGGINYRFNWGKTPVVAKY